MISVRTLLPLVLLSTLLIRAQTEAPEKAPEPPPAVEKPEAEKAAVEQPAVEKPAVPDPLDQEPAEPVETEWDAPKFRPQHRGSRTVFGEKVVVPKGDVIDELVLIGGSADIQGEVERDVVAIGASVDVSGRVGGQVVIIGGKGTFSGRVKRDTVVVLGRADVASTARLGHGVFLGGPFNIDPGSHISGDPVIMPFGDFLPQIEWLKRYFVRGPLLGRWLSFDLTWPWVVAGTFLAVYLGLLLAFPAAARAVYTALEERPVTSIFTGLLFLILLAPLLFLLVLSIAGILVIPFLKISILLALLFGKVGVLCFIGRGVGKTTGMGTLQAPLLAFVAGSVILTLSYAIPLFGIIAWALATVFGLGGAIVALSNTFKREEASVPPAAVLVSTMQPGSATYAPGPESVPGATPPPLVSPYSNFANLNPQDTILLPRAGFWTRFLAAILDLLLVGLAVAILPVIGPALFIPTAVAYFVVMWTWRGTTLGGLVLRHKIVRTNGQPVNFAVALVRSLTSLFSLLVAFLGFLWAGWDREKQTWHDKIAGTVVVRMPPGFSLI